MKKEEFDLLPTWEFMAHNKNVICPICGTKNEAPYPNCKCRSTTECKEYPKGYHIMKYHHECLTPPNPLTYQV